MNYLYKSYQFPKFFVFVLKFSEIIKGGHAKGWKSCLPSTEALKTMSSTHGFTVVKKTYTQKVFWSLSSFDTPLYCLSDHHG